MPDAARTSTLSALALDALPPIPAVALRVMQVAQDARSSASDLANVVVADPGLSIAMLRVVNSAAHRRLVEITSVKEALVLLGFVQARNVAIAGAIAFVFAPTATTEHFSVEAFWRHSLGVAFRASDLASERGRVDPGTAFTAGVIHNMARLAMYFTDPWGLDRATASAVARGITLEQAERELLDYDHCVLGAELARRWQLPSAIREAIAGHHGEAKAPSLASLLASADRYCMDHGLMPGYAVPPAESGGPDPIWEKTVHQVDVLTAMILAGPRRGV